MNERGGRREPRQKGKKKREIHIHISLHESDIYKQVAKSKKGKEKGEAKKKILPEQRNRGEISVDFFGMC